MTWTICRKIICTVGQVYKSKKLLKVYPTQDGRYSRCFY